MMAQRTADDHVSDARREADKLLSDARTKAEEVTREARAKADALERDARQRHQEAMGGLDAKRTALQKHIEELKQFEREYRTRLKAYLESQLRDLDGRGQGLEAEMTADRRQSVRGAGSPGLATAGLAGSYGGAATLRLPRSRPLERLDRRRFRSPTGGGHASPDGAGSASRVPGTAGPTTSLQQAAGVSRDRRKSGAHPRRCHAARARTRRWFERVAGQFDRRESARRRRARRRRPPSGRRARRRTGSLPTTSAIRVPATRMPNREFSTDRSTARAERARTPPGGRHGTTGDVACRGRASRSRHRRTDPGGLPVHRPTTTTLVDRPTTRRGASTTTRTRRTSRRRSRARRPTPPGWPGCPPTVLVIDGRPALPPPGLRAPARPRGRAAPGQRGGRPRLHAVQPVRARQRTARRRAGASDRSCSKGTPCPVTRVERALLGTMRHGRRSITVAVRVKPGASRPGSGGRHDGPHGPALVVAVTAPAVDGRATEAARRALAEALGLRARRGVPADRRDQPRQALHRRTARRPRRPVLLGAGRRDALP